MTPNADMNADVGERQHDPLCPSAYTMQCECDLIFRVRDDVWANIRQPGRIAEAIAAEREAMRAACIAAVLDYATRRQELCAPATPCEDITAALRVAATRIDALKEDK